MKRRPATQDMGELRLMSALFAYHRTHTQGQFKQTYYFTKKTNPKIGDNIYVISGDSKKAPKYFLEGFYIIHDIGRIDGERRKLLLKPLLRGVSPPCISEEAWFDNKEFHKMFTSGQSMNPVPDLYEARFHEMLAGSERLKNSEGDAINDIGTDYQERSLGYTSSYLRDPEVRKAVMLRAKGNCEYCGRQGFLCVDGTPYLESHHIRALAEDGADRMSNVIALCSEDHRQAHFGANRDEIETKMVEIVSKLVTGLRA